MILTSRNDLLERSGDTRSKGRNQVDRKNRESNMMEPSGRRGGGAGGKGIKRGSQGPEGEPLVLVVPNQLHASTILYLHRAEPGKTQLVKNQPTIQDTPVGFLGGVYPLENG